MKRLIPIPLLATLLISAVLAAPSGAQTRPTVAPTIEKLKIDLEHSSATFRVRHLFTKVNGSFRELSGAVEFNPKEPARSSVSATIKAATIDTNNKSRDEDLRSKRFFEVETYPEITFKSSKVEVVGKDHWKVTGLLTMHGVAKAVTLDTQYLGAGKDPWGNQRYGFHAETRIDRKDFGLTWNEAIETGGVMVGDEVEIGLDIEAVPAKD